MLANGLGKIVRHEASQFKRFVDLFAGSGAVAWHVAENTGTEVLAADLQEFSVVLTNAVIARTNRIDLDQLWSPWIHNATKAVQESGLEDAIVEIESLGWMSDPEGLVERSRLLCAEAGSWPMTLAYGGYYFSPRQALYLDALRRTLPDGSNRSIALAALIQAASECAASPGHTAQAFKPTATGAPFLFDAWKRDVSVRTRDAIAKMCHRYSQTIGTANVSSALQTATTLRDSDLAFIDPPYSNVQYSRFYHVLETITRGEGVDVSGIGRYPPRDQRPQSDFSLPSKSMAALDELFSELAGRGVRSIMTYLLNPAGRRVTRSCEDAH